MPVSLGSVVANEIKLVKFIERKHSIMTEFNNNNKYIPKAPETFQVAYLKTNQEVKQSPLSPAARSKVIRKWGSDYVSEDREGYGPCTSSNCTHSRSELQEQLRELERKLRELENNQEQKPVNYLPWIIGGSVLVIGIIISVLILNNKKKKHYY